MLSKATVYTKYMYLYKKLRKMLLKKVTKFVFNIPCKHQQSYRLYLCAAHSEKTTALRKDGTKNFDYSQQKLKF